MSKHGEWDVIRSIVAEAEIDVTKTQDEIDPATHLTNIGSEVYDVTDNITIMAGKMFVDIHNELLGPPLVTAATACFERGTFSAEITDDYERAERCFRYTVECVFAKALGWWRDMDMNQLHNDGEMQMGLPAEESAEALKRHCARVQMVADRDGTHDKVRTTGEILGHSTTAADIPTDIPAELRDLLKHIVGAEEDRKAHPEKREKKEPPNMGDYIDPPPNAGGYL